MSKCPYISLHFYDSKPGTQQDNTTWAFEPPTLSVKSESGSCVIMVYRMPSWSRDHVWAQPWSHVALHRSVFAVCCLLNLVSSIVSKLYIYTAYILWSSATNLPSVKWMRSTVLEKSPALQLVRYICICILLLYNASRRISKCFPFVFWQYAHSPFFF